MSPDAVRDALIEAATAGDSHRIDELAHKQRAVILENFSSWQKVPESIRADAGETKRYVGALIAVAEHFKSALDDPSLTERLAGTPDKNPLSKWQKALRSAREAFAGARYSEAEEVLREGMATARGASGPGVDLYLPMTWGLMGQCRLHQGKIPEAVALFWKALELSERTGNIEGQLAHLSSLHEANRWLGETAEAAALADRLAERATQAGDSVRAEWARARAKRVRDGEPLNRVVLEVGGNKLELDELRAPLPEGRLRFHFERNRIELGAVSALVDNGARLGSEGDDAGALGCFRSAATIDPWDPRPPYLAGLAQMGLERYPDAVESYETTERLAPGWYHCRADRALALDLAARRVSRVTFEAVRRIEDGDKSASEKVALADVALADAPDLAMLHLLKANALIELKSASEAAEAARAGLTRDPDPDVRTRLLIALARVTPTHESRRLLEEAVALDGNRIASAMARVMLLPREVN